MLKWVRCNLSLDQNLQRYKRNIQIKWYLYPKEDYSSRFYAVLFPASVSFFLFISYITPPSFLSKFLLETMSREGKLKELIEGPFIYGIVISIITIFFWNETPHGILSILILCLGDGMADVIGSRGTHVLKAPFGRKTIEGCVSFIVFSFVGCLIYEYIFFNTIWFIQTFIVVIVGCIVEFVSPSLLDNMLIVIASVITCYLFNWN